MDNAKLWRGSMFKYTIHVHIVIPNSKWEGMHTNLQVLYTAVHMCTHQSMIAIIPNNVRT